MFNGYKDRTLEGRNLSRAGALFAWVMGLALLCGSHPVAAQDQPSQAPPSQSPAPTSSQSPDNGKPKQDVPAEAGGPTDKVGPYATPKKKAKAPPPPPPPVAPKKLEDIPDYSLKVN